MRLEPGWYMGYGDRALAYEDEGHFDLALADLNKALTLSPGSKELLEIQQRVMSKMKQ